MRKNEIMITGNSKVKGGWRHPVTNTGFQFIMVNTTPMAYTTRSYYYDTQDDKIRYERLKESFAVYAEVQPKIYVYVGMTDRIGEGNEAIDTEDLNKYAQKIRTLNENQIMDWYAKLKEV